MPLPSPLPLILAGPILRRVEPDRVAVWVAISQQVSVSLTLYGGNAVPAGSTAALSGTGSSRVIKLGPQLYVALAELVPGTNLLPAATYSYDLSVGGNGLGTLLEGDGALGYTEHLLPTFQLPPGPLTQLVLLHGSCRKPH